MLGDLDKTDRTAQLNFALCSLGTSDCSSAGQNSSYGGSMHAKAVLEFAAANNVKMLDIRFTDLPGLWHHVSFPIHQLSIDSFEDGFGMDGSSIRGWAAIHESDMLLVPDPNWCMMDPFTDVPTLVLIGDIIDPLTKQRYLKDPRHIAQKAVQYLLYTGVA